MPASVYCCHVPLPQPLALRVQASPLLPLTTTLLLLLLPLRLPLRPQSLILLL